MKKKVLVLCTGNSCRSIMAEAMINHYLGDRWEACSAGVSPSLVHPRTIKVLHEMGIGTAELRSKSVREFLSRQDLDLVITVCDNAREQCPVFTRPVEQIHIGIPDPVSYVPAPEEDSLAGFRKAAEQIQRTIIERLAQLEQSGEV